jgi:hypothetical protein
MGVKDAHGSASTSTNLLVTKSWHPALYGDCTQTVSTLLAALCCCCPSYPRQWPWLLLQHMHAQTLPSVHLSAAQPTSAPQKQPVNPCSQAAHTVHATIRLPRAVRASPEHQRLSNTAARQHPYTPASTPSCANSTYCTQAKSIHCWLQH